MINEKILDVNGIAKIVDELKKQGKKIVTTNGVFDILHLGHVKYLEEAKQLGDILIVGINSDASVKQNKGDKRPVNDENSRAGVMAALESVDYIFIFNEKDPTQWIPLIKPDFHVKAGDYKADEMVERYTVEDAGGKIVIAKLEKGYSTTDIIGKILEMNKQ